MRFSVAVVSLFVASASAVYSPIHRRQFPDCATSCITNANLDGCSATDDTCLCKSSVFVQTTFACIQAACTGSNLQAAITDAEGLCLAVGITLGSSTGAPTLSGSSTSSASSSSTAVSTTAHSSSASTTAAGTSPTATAPSSTSNTAATSSASSNAFSNAALASVPSAQHAFAGLAAIGLAALVL